MGKIINLEKISLLKMPAKNYQKTDYELMGEKTI